MTNLVFDTLMTLAPSNRKRTSSGWNSFNGPCCVYNGELRPDTRKRCSIIIANDNAVLVSCFNCKFRAIWKPGQNLSTKMKNFLEWMGLPSDELKKLNFRIWQLRETAKLTEDIKPREYVKLEFEERSLPKGAQPLSYWLEQGTTDPNFLEVLAYLNGRGDEILTGCDYYWTPETENDLNRRIIIPFRWEGKLVGWTGRAAFPTGRRYYSEVQPQYFFNSELAQNDWEYLFVVEGPFDGIAISGVAMLGDKLTEEQIRWLNHTGKTIIVVPDMVDAGGILVDVATQQGWHVSFPEWDKGIKDAADAVKTYGRLYTIWSIIDARTKDRLSISVKRQRLR